MLGACPEDSTTDDTDHVEMIGNEVTSISVFPNPVHTEIQVSWDNAFHSLTIMNMDGRKVLRKEYRNPLKSTSLPLQLEPGIYFLILDGRETSGVTKLLIE